MPAAPATGRLSPDSRQEGGWSGLSSEFKSSLSYIARLSLTTEGLCGGTHQKCTSIQKVEAGGPGDQG